MNSGFKNVVPVGKDKAGIIFKDIMIGIIIALVSIPISMGYSQVAGLPVVYGLYGSLFPIMIYAVITSSPRFVFGVDAAPAALVGGMLANMAITPGTHEAREIVELITVFVTLWLFLFYIFKADRLIKFISHPVMGGFITGIGITIILMQIPKLFGGVSGTGEAIELIRHIVFEADKKFHMLSFGLGLMTVIIILISKKLCPKLPIQVVVMITGAALTYFFHIDKYGVATLPKVAGGLPKPVLPDFTLLHKHATDIILPSMTIAMVICTETLLATSNNALKNDDRIEGRREILAYGMGNLMAAAFAVCPVNGSVSRTGIAGQYKVQSQVMSLTAGVTMLLILLFGTGFIEYLPVPVLTGIVIAALIGTFEFDLAIKLKKVDKEEYMIFYAVLAAVLVLGTVYAVVVGVIMTQFTFIIRQSKPKTAFLGVVDNDDGYHDLKGTMGESVPIKDVVIYRFTGTLFFANIEQFCDELFYGIKEDTKVIIIDATGIGSVDVTAAERLVYIYHKFKDSGRKFYIAGHVSHVNDQLHDFGAGELIKDGVVRSRISLALRACGLDRPYEKDQEYISTKRPFAKRFAEFSWAYGKHADEKMQELVHTIALEIAREGQVDVTAVFDKEKQLAGGYWNDADEALFLGELEMELALLAQQGRLTKENEETIEESIGTRYGQLEKILEERLEGSSKKIDVKLKEHESRFMKKHPKAYEHFQKEHER